MVQNLNYHKSNFITFTRLNKLITKGILFINALYTHISMKLKSILISTIILSAGLLFINATFLNDKGGPKPKKDALDKRIFIVTMTEIKDGAVPKKGVEDEIEFRTGKGMFSNFLFEKMEYQWMKYEIKKDSTFTDEENNEVRWIEGAISTTDDKDQTTVIEFTVEDYDINGEIKVTKKDKLKKRYEFTGKEKAKKVKK